MADKKFLDEDGVSQFAEETKKYVDKHANNADIHVTAADKAIWNGKQDALTAEQLAAVNSGINATDKGNYDAHIANADIHVTATDKSNWNGKQNSLSSQQIANINDVVNKANDSDVVHKTGDETAAGVKTFSDGVVGNVTGNASSATKLQTARTINGTSFNGTANITTANWGTARNISITDGTNTSTAVSVNGSKAYSLNLPSTIKATFVGNITGNVTGNADTSTKATNNASGNALSNDIIKGLSVNGKVITYTKLDGSTGTITTQDTNTTYSNFVKSGSGAKAGLVPAPSTTAGTTKYLREDGTWQVPPDHTYTVNNATLTIQKNGTTVKTFTANASSNVTCNITVPTKISDLTNDSGFVIDVSGKADKATTLSGYGITDAYTKTQVDKKVSDLVNSAPETLDTLNELASALGNDPNFATTVSTEIGKKLDTTTASSTYIAKGDGIVGLSVSGKVITYTKGDGSTGTITTQDTNTTYSNFVKSGSGAKAGLVPAPSTTAGTTKYLREDGTWQVPPDHTYTVNNATLTIQKNGTTVKTFTANASANVTANIVVPTKTSELTNDSGFLTTALPIGSYIQFAGSQAPDGFLVCNGGAISRTTYSKLFEVIGTTYGSGDGSTTFNLPNLTDRFLQGSASVGTVKNAGLPNISGDLYSNTIAAIGVQTTGCFNHSTFGQFAPEVTVVHYGTHIDFFASRSSAIYGNSETVQPNAVTCLICIKY